jgi:hypothetical protein
MGKKRFWILIGIGSVIVIFFILLSNILEVGERLRSIHQYVEYAFYGLSALLVYFLIINPIRIIVFSPTFTVEAMLSDDAARHKIYKDAVKVLLTNESITDQDKELLKATLNNKEELRNALQQVWQSTIHDNINDAIVRNAKSVLLTTAISQNGNLDMLSTLVINLRLIREVVELSGFRPSYPYLAKLSVNVLITSLIADGIEDIDISKYMPTKLGETLNDIPFVKTISGSIVNGIANSMLTCRVGIITKRYLYNDNKLIDRKEIRKTAYKDAFKLMPKIVGEGLSIFPKGVAAVFTRPFKKRQKNEEEDNG